MRRPEAGLLKTEYRAGLPAKEIETTRDYRTEEPCGMLSYIDVIPAKTTIRRGESLNLLGGAANNADTLDTDMHVWGNAGSGWKSLTCHRVTIEKGEHKHLYFTLRPEMLTETFPDEEVEELELIIRDTEPAPQENGVLVFISD